jgi:hypothetical protein
LPAAFLFPNTPATPASAPSRKSSFCNDPSTTAGRVLLAQAS